MALHALGPFWYQTLFRFFVETYQNIPYYAHLDLGSGSALGGKALIVVFLCAAPIAALAFMTVWLANLLQVGVLITFKPLSIEEGIKKLNPINGFKRLFSMKQVFELVKSAIKIFIIGWTIYGVVAGTLGSILMAVSMQPGAAMGLAGGLVLTIAERVALAMGVIAAVDYFFQKWQYEKSLRMSHKEVKDEYKKLEGDPLVKSRQRQKQMEMAMSAMRHSVGEADVVVTNPTHYAIALAYKPRAGMKAPKVVAKGKDRQALEIRRIAEENFILVVEDPPLAQTLFAQVPVDGDIPPDLFHAVAKIIALLYRGRRKAPAPKAPESLVPVAAPPVFEVLPDPSRGTPPARRDPGAPPDSPAS